MLIFNNAFVAVRIREILDSVGLSQERLPPSAVGSALVIATVANLLSIRDTEMSRWFIFVRQFDLQFFVQ